MAAASNHARTDQDRDGLSDLQELVIGTLPYRADSDGDTYSDLEERARASDPLDAASVPDVVEFSLGTCASQENGFVSAVSAVYLHGVPFDAVRLNIGVVYQGRALRIMPNDYPFTRGFLKPGRDPGDTLAVVEMGVPEALVARLGHLNLFSVLSSNRPGGPDPIVGLVPLASFSGVIMSIENRAAAINNTGGGATGVVYRPLAGDDQIPSTWSGGEICFQSTSAVGMHGVSIVHEIDASDCVPMDTYCSPGDCAGGVGTPLELPDPGALAGG